MKDAEVIIAHVIFEQGMEETLHRNIPRLRKLDEDGMSIIAYNRHIINDDGQEVEIRDFFGENFWCCLVELWGDYGVTMRTGWIEDKDSFFEMIILLHEMNQGIGGENYG